MRREVRTQAELDEALAFTDVPAGEWLYIDIVSDAGVWLEVGRAAAYGSSTVRAYGSSTVRAYGSSTVAACDSSTVTACDSSTVRAYGSSTVAAYGSSTVRAYGSSTVRAYGSSTVTATSHVAVHLHHATATVEGGVVIDVSQSDQTDIDTWIEYTGAETVGTAVVLYKAVDANLKSERGFSYPIGETVECPDWTETNDCGGGLHLSPHTVQALAYFQGATRFLRCTVDRADLRPIPGSPAKAKARRVTVVEEVSL